jgi:hypothetical protein
VASPPSKVLAPRHAGVDHDDVPGADVLVLDDELLLVARWKDDVVVADVLVEPAGGPAVNFGITDREPCRQIWLVPPVCLAEKLPTL